MKFLCVGYFDSVKMQALSPEAVEAAMSACPSHMNTLYQTGTVTFVAGADCEARHLQLTDGKLTVSDHGGDERSRIGCVFVLEAADMEEAVRLAALHPTTQIAAGEGLGWRTEVRPAPYFYGGKGDLPAGCASEAAA